jgi:serine/threonine protein kinase/Flp pilus assembly protein TadD
VPVPIFQHAADLAQVETQDFAASDASPNCSGTTDPRVFAAVEDYLRQCEAGSPPDIEEFADQHAAISSELRACLAGLAFLQKAAPNIELSSAAITASATMDQVGHEPLGDYRLIREIGRGGMGIVYEAEQLSLSRRVALKILPFAAVLDPRHLQRFKNEALAAAHLSHPHIVDVYGIGCERSIHFYAMRLIEGQTLAAVIEALKDEGRSPKDESGTPLPPRERLGEGYASPSLNPEPRTLNPIADTSAIAALSTLRETKPRDYFRRIAELGIQAAEALDHAHQMGIVHRDIKPSNLMIDNFGKLWITDFGLARFLNEPGMTMTGDLLGTLRYMSPEQAEGKSAVLDHRTDIYSLGITLYEFLTLQPAFPAADRQALLRQIAQDEPPVLRKLNKHIPADLETILLKSIAKDPRDRYVSAADLAADLNRFTNQQPVRARRATLLDRSRRWIGRHATLVSIAFAALVLVAAAGITAAVLIGRAYQSEVTEHDRAEYNLGLAVAAVEKMLTRVGSDPGYFRDEHRAEQVMSDALHFHETLLKHQNHDPKYVWLAVTTYRRAVIIRYFGGVFDKVEPALRRASELLDELVRLEPENAEYLDALGENQLELGWLLWVIDKRAQVEPPLRRALEIYEQRVKRFPTNSAYQLRLAETLNELGRFHLYTGQLEKAESEIARAAKISASLPAEVRGPFPQEPLRLQGAILSNQALLARSRKDIPQALKLLEQAIAVQDRALVIWPEDERCQDYGLRHYFDRAETFLYAGKHREAAQAIERMLLAHDKSLAAHHLGAELLLRCAHLAERSHLAPRDVASLPPHAEQDGHIAAKYRKRAHELVELIKNSDKATIPTTVSADHFAWFLLTCPDESFRDPERALLIAQTITQLAPERASARLALGFAQYRLKKWGEAEAALAGLVAGRIDVSTDAGALFVLAMIQWQRGDRDVARRTFDRAIAIPVEKPSDSIVVTLAREAAELLNVRNLAYGDRNDSLGPAPSTIPEYSGLDPADLADVDRDNSQPGFLYTIDFGSDLIQRSSLQGANVETLVDLKALFGGADKDYDPRYLDIDSAGE